MAQPADIYDFIVRQGTPSKLPGPWGVFKCDPAFFNLEVAPETLLRRLQSEFKSDDLNRAHVTKGNGKRATVLSPPLADNRSFIVAVRPKAEEKPRALLFDGMDKTLGGRWVLDAALADHHVRELLESLSRQLLIVSSAEDLAVRSWDRIERLLQKELIEPLLKQAEETADPLEKSLGVQLAGLTGTLHTQLLRLATGAANSGGAPGPRGPRGLPNEDLQQILALLDRVRTLTQDVQVCRKNNRFKLASLTRAKKTRPSSQRSDSALRRPPR